MRGDHGFCLLLLGDVWVSLHESYAALTETGCGHEDREPRDSSAPQTDTITLAECVSGTLRLAASCEGLLLILSWLCCC